MSRSHYVGYSPKEAQKTTLCGADKQQRTKNREYLCPICTFRTSAEPEWKKHWKAAHSSPDHIRLAHATMNTAHVKGPRC